MTGVTRYPLSWPVGWKRATVRRQAKFHGTRRVSYSGGSTDTFRQKKPLDLSEALNRLYAELRRLGVRDADVLISSDLKLRMDGLPFANQAHPSDPGVAVYFNWRKRDQVLACDTWTRIPDNIAAIAAHIECIRGIERYGVGTLEQAFAGYQGLPAKGQTWRTSLGFTPDETVDRAMVEEAFRRRARGAHPDVEGGSHDAMASLVAARDEAFTALETSK